MKIRTSFVSNSSSASYVIKIDNITMGRFLDILEEEYSWSHFEMSSIEEEISDSYRQVQNLTKVGGTFHDLKDSWIKCETEKQERLKEIKSSRDLVSFVLWLRDIRVSQGKNCVILSHWTSMHNNYVQGMNDLMKEIILLFVVEKKYPITGAIVKEG